VRNGECGLMNVAYGRRRLPLLVLTSWLSFSTSCRTLPAPAPGEMARVANACEAALPLEYEARQTLVFEVKPRWWWPTIRMTALGYAQVNRKTGDYAVVCLSPVGMKVFDAVRTNGQDRVRLAFPTASAKAQEVERAIGADLGVLYSKLAPAPGTVVRRGGDRWEFCERHGDSVTRYEFRGTPLRLVMKDVSSPAGRTVLTFGDYREAAGRTYPALVTLTNRRHGYKLTIRTHDFAAFGGKIGDLK